VFLGWGIELSGAWPDKYRFRHFFSGKERLARKALLNFLGQILMGCKTA
jgi:hypothetical protein